jgi:hypothetical protein
LNEELAVVKKGRSGVSVDDRRRLSDLEADAELEDVDSNSAMEVWGLNASSGGTEDSSDMDEEEDAAGGSEAKDMITSGSRKSMLIRGRGYISSQRIREMLTKRN